MLKTLSLLPEGARDAEDEDNDNSESRMLRALEALGQHQPAPQQAQRDEMVFRQNRTPRDGGREQARDQAASHQARGRHRFVRDGEVPVVHMAVTRPRDAATPPVGRDGETIRLQQALEEQRQRAEQAERAKSEALLQLKLLQTKCAHAEMTAGDNAALAEARLQELTQAQEALRALQAATVAPAPAIAAPPTFDTLFPLAPREAPARRGRPRLVVAPPPAQVAEEEPEPVQWWLAPTKATAKRARR